MPTSLNSVAIVSAAFIDMHHVDFPKHLVVRNIYTSIENDYNESMQLFRSDIYHIKDYLERPSSECCEEHESDCYQDGRLRTLQLV